MPQIRRFDIDSVRELSKITRNRIQEEMRGDSHRQGRWDEDHILMASRELHSIKKLRRETQVISRSRENGAVALIKVSYGEKGNIREVVAFESTHIDYEYDLRTKAEEWNWNLYGRDVDLTDEAMRGDAIRQIQKGGNQ